MSQSIKVTQLCHQTFQAAILKFFLHGGTSCDGKRERKLSKAACLTVGVAWRGGGWGANTTLKQQGEQNKHTYTKRKTILIRISLPHNSQALVGREYVFYLENYNSPTIMLI